MKKTIVLILLLLHIIPLLSGCWNQKELNDLAFVMAMGIDKGKDQRFDVTFQLVNPGNVSSGQGGGGGQGLPIAVYKTSGDTLTEAARNATKKVSRRLYYAHTNIIVISEKLAREGIYNLLDAFEREPEFRTTTEIIIANDSTAEDIVATLTLLDKLPTSKIKKELDTTEKLLGENIKVNVDDLVSALVSKGRQPMISGYRLVGDKEESRKADNLNTTTTLAYLKADGLAVFNDGKLKGWINNENARGAVWILNKVKSTDINLDWKGKKAALNLTPIRSKTKVTAKIKNGKPIIQVVLKEESVISEINTSMNLDNPTTIQEIKKITEEKIEKEIMNSIKAAQRQKCDIFGFGEKVHLANPKLWKKIEKNWDEQFANTKVTVKVYSFNRRAGIRRDPFLNLMK
jgi:spore germination protein KC